ncbi:hypothetical protein J7L24_00925 [bacterium]|nr:hypothetical protein [bacterium]
MTNKSKAFQIFCLSTLGLFVLVLGFFQIRGAIYGPFEGFGKSRKEEKTTLTQEEILSILSEHAKQEDTDKDGISDYDEVYVYKTSPYIQDSDSDAFSDQEEIEAGSDPLNPNSTPYRQDKDAESNLSEDSMPEVPENEQFSSEDIRNFLIQAGIAKEIVDNINDNDLKKLYNDTKEETGIDPQDLESSYLPEVDISLLRQALIDEGVDALMLEQIDDDTLKEMFLQSLAP